MLCSRCNSDRVAYVSAHASDCFYYFIPGVGGTNYYLPNDWGIGGGDDLEMNFCMNCGQIQGEFPLPETEFEREKPEKKWILAHTNRPLWLNNKNQWSNFFDAKVFTEEEKENYRYYQTDIHIPPFAEWVEA